MDTRTKPLEFRADGTFTIIQFTDLHYRNGERADRRTLQLMKQVLESIKPDLVVLTGDTIDGGFCRDPVASFASAVQPIIDHRLPWAAVFGNHDDEGSAKRGQLMAAIRRLPGCLADAGPAEISGVGNYVLPVTAHGAPAVNLWFLDSHAYADSTGKTYDWIKQDQIDWFLENATDLPSLVFFHIPLPEFDDVWNTGACIGEKNEPVCCPRFNSGLFAAMKSAGNVMGVFVGHDHTNDYAGDLAGIRLCYGRCTGYSSYGRTGFERGARVIRLRAGRRGFETWVRLRE